MRRRPLGPIAAATLVVAFGSTASTATADLGLPDREADPVVLKGADVPTLTGVQPDSVVAFSYDGHWTQVPVQVDERAVVDYSAVRQGHQTAGRPFSHEAFTDAGTFAGPDPDPTLDDGDEIAMMAKDAGSAANGVASPHGVDASTRTKVGVNDPIDSTKRFIYLFETDSDLDPAAGKAYVDYDFSLDSGDYKTTYSFSGVPGGDNGGPTEGPANLESSTVTTPFYEQHLLSRWVEDRLRIRAGDATAVDVLDGDKAQVSFGCGRSDLTFSRGGGGFIANKSGPVRAIRSYIGANSGTYTQQDRIYYERSEVMTTYLRVHPGIDTIDQFLDYSPAASGMTYRTSADPAGVTIDGVPDPALETGNGLGPQIDWEQATGAQGSLSIVSRVDTDIPTYAAGSYYQDDSTSPATPQCGGYADAQAWGSSGPGITGVGVNTDPTLGDFNSLTGTRTIFYDEPGADAALAELRAEQVDAPLATTAKAEEEPGQPVLSLKVKGRNRTVERGRGVRIPVVVRNTGDAAAKELEVCARAPKRVATTGRCKGSKRLAVGEARRYELRINASESAKRFIRANYRASAANAKRDKAKAKVGIRR